MKINANIPCSFWVLHVQILAQQELPALCVYHPLLWRSVATLASTPHWTALSPLILAASSRENTNVSGIPAQSCARLDSTWALRTSWKLRAHQPALLKSATSVSAKSGETWSSSGRPTVVLAPNPRLPAFPAPSKFYRFDQFLTCLETAAAVCITPP